MKQIDIKALMLLTLAIPSLHGANLGRLWSPTKTYAGTYWQQTPRFFSSSLPRYAAPTADEIQAAEKAQEALRKKLRIQFANAYFNTLKEKVGRGAYREYSPGQLLDEAFQVPQGYWHLKGSFPKNSKTIPAYPLSERYADIMMNQKLSPQQSQLALKELAKDQGRHFAATLQRRIHSDEMQKLLEKLTGQDSAENRSLSIRYAGEKQFGINPNAADEIRNYLTAESLKEGSPLYSKWNVFNRTPEQRKLMELLSSIKD